VDGGLRVPVDPTPTPAGIFHSSRWRRRWKFDRANLHRGEIEMRNQTFFKASMISALAMIFLFGLNAFGQEMGGRSHRDGYGAYGTMGQNPEEIMKYGRDMMRYGFREMDMPGGSNKYPGYYSDLSDETIEKLNAEQESFIRATEDLRQTIYEKELYLKAELVKKAPDTAMALSLQKMISETRGIFEQHMIEHIIRMKKINLDAESK
jgi:hypothetical protein